MEHMTNLTRHANDEEPGCNCPPQTGTAEQSAEAAPFLGATAQRAAASVAQTAAGVASFVGRKAEDAASYMGHKAEDAAAYVSHKTDDAGAAVGGGLRSLGQNVRDQGPEGGMAGSASAAVAGTLDSSGRYLQEEGIKDMAKDVTNLIRRNPIPALLIGIAAGYLAGKAMTPRS